MASGADEANKMKDIATEMGKTKATLAESGRKTWLDSITNLQAQKPSGQWNTVIKPDQTNQILNTVGEIGAATTNYGISQDSNNWLEKLLDKYKYGMPDVAMSPWSLNTSGWR